MTTTDDSSASSLTFPHPILTPIKGKPTNVTLLPLKKELYSNAIAIHSTRGGGANGHLAMLMPAATYLNRAGEAFVIPVHPGPAPVHPAGATGAQITEINRLYDKNIAEHQLYLKVATKLKNQLLQAVDKIYLSILEDPEFGYADVQCGAMLSHLLDTYGVVDDIDITTNRNRLDEPWNPDVPMENIWIRIREVQLFATSAGPNEAISDKAVIRAILPTFEDSGLLLHACEMWNDKAPADQTLEAFMTHFTHGDKERIRKLTTRTAGYHGANTATDTPPASNATANTATDTPPASAIANDGTRVYYCWTHGLGTNKAHTGPTCQHKADGHKDEATVTNMMGGNAKIMGRRPNRDRGTRE